MKITLTSSIDITGASEPLLRKIRDNFIIKTPGGLTTAKCLNGIAGLISLGG